MCCKRPYDIKLFGKPLYKLTN
jgi:hypothetical protein